MSFRDGPAFTCVTPLNCGKCDTNVRSSPLCGWLVFKSDWNAASTSQTAAWARAALLCIRIRRNFSVFLSAKPPSRATIPNSEQLDLRPGICQSQLFTSELLPRARPQAHQCTTNFRTSPKGNLMKTRCRAESQNPTCLLLPNPLVDTGRNRWKL